MKKKPDPTDLLKHQMRINAAIKEAERLTEYWALRSKAHLDKGQTSKAWAALRRAEQWEHEAHETLKLKAK